MGTTITVEESTLERFNELKELHSEPNLPEMNADQFVNSLLDTLEAVDEGHYGEADDPLTLSEVDEIAEQLNESVGGGSVDDDLREQLNRIEAAAKEATNAAQNAEKAISEVTGQ